MLFALAPEPSSFASSVVYENPGAEFQRVASFGRYHFGPANCPPSARSIITVGVSGDGFRLEGFLPSRSRYVTIFSR